MNVVKISYYINAWELHSYYKSRMLYNATAHAFGKYQIHLTCSAVYAEYLSRLSGHHTLNRHWLNVCQ